MAARLLRRVDRVEHDAVRLQRDRLRDARRARIDRALAVDAAHLPADHAPGLLDPLAHAARAAVALVGGDIDDELVADGLRPGGRAGPFA